MSLFPTLQQWLQPSNYANNHNGKAVVADGGWTKQHTNSSQYTCCKEVTQATMSLFPTLQQWLQPSNYANNHNGKAVESNGDWTREEDEVGKSGKAVSRQQAFVSNLKSDSK
jgi:hypothetical protein